MSTFMACHDDGDDSSRILYMTANMDFSMWHLFSSFSTEAYAENMEDIRGED